MAQINKKYMEDFEKLARNWEKLQRSPNQESLNLVRQDLEQFQRDLKNIHLS